MARTTNFVFLVLLAFSSLAIAQDSRPSPQTPEDAFTTRQLIAWSDVQKPKPAPEPAPSGQDAVPSPGQSPDQQPNAPSDKGAEQKPVAQTFTGRIVKDGEKYALKGAGATYQLDQTEDLQQYENRSVRITGNLDPSGNTIHVAKIEAMS